MPDVLMTVAQGIVPHPGNRPKRAEFSFESGGTIILEGELLQMWFNAYVALLQTFNQVLSEPPAIDSERVRNLLRNEEKQYKRRIKPEEQE